MIQSNHFSLKTLILALSAFNKEKERLMVLKPVMSGCA